MKEKNFSMDLEAIHQNAVEMKKAIIELIPKNILDGPKYDNMVHLVIVDGNDTWISGKLSHIEVDRELGTITFSNFRRFKNGAISECQLVKQMAINDIENFDLFDLSIELYDEKGELYTSAHVTKVYRDPMGIVYLTNEENKNLKF